MMNTNNRFTGTIHKPTAATPMVAYCTRLEQDNSIWSWVEVLNQRSDF